MDGLVAWTLSRFGHGALDTRTYWYSVAVGNGCTGSMDVIKVRARCPRHARGGLDEFELKSLGKHGRDGVDTDGKPAARRVVVGLNPEP